LRALEQLAEMAALAAVHPALAWSPRASDALRDGGRVADTLAYGFALLAARARASDAAGIVERLRLKRGEAAAVRDVVALVEAMPLLTRPNVKASGATQILERYTDAAVAAFAATEDGIGAEIARRYLAQWRDVRPALTASDVVALGVPAGPRIAQALQLLRAARLDEIALDADDERVLVARFVAAIRDSTKADAAVELRANGH
jgi:hypothetical protein